MSNFAFLLFFALVWNSNGDTGSESLLNNQQISGKLLKHLNEEQGTKYQFNHAKTIETQFKDEQTYFLVDVSPVCKDVDDALCAPADMVCQGAIKGDEVSKVRCFLKESHPLMPQYEQGYLIKRSNSFINDILEHGLQKLERDTGRKRRVIEILSVKKRETKGTEVFITSKVSASSEGNGDVLELEVCELAATLGDPGSMQILDTKTVCFALADEFNAGKGNGLVTTDELKALVHWALEKMNVGTDTVFNHTVTEIMKAETSVTPASGGTMTTMQLKMAVTGCPKKDFLPEVQWKCEGIDHPIACTVSSWERPWAGDTLLSRPRCKKMPVVPSVEKDTVDDVAKTQKGYCTGCLQEVNKEDVKVIELANSAIEELNGGQLSATPHKLFKVVSAHRQVINGVRYVLNLELTPCVQDSTPCTVDGNAEASLKCRIEIIEGAIDRQRRLSSSLCQSTLEEATTIVDEVTTTESSQPPTPQEVEVYSDEDHAKEAEIVDAPAPTSGQIEQEDPVVYNQPHSTHKRTRRSDGLLGSPQPVDLEKEGEKMRKLAETAMKSIDDIDDDATRRKLINLVEAKKQVVNGNLYHLTMRVGVMPPCENGETECVDGQLPTLLCKVQVHEAQAETSNAAPVVTVMRSECEPEGAFEIQEAGNPGDGGPPSNHAPASRTRRSILKGGVATADINDPYIQEIAKFSVTEMDKESNALYHRTIVRLIEAKKQVVAGTLVHLTYELGYSDCRKGTDNDLEQCKLTEGSEKEICEVKVWDRPWLKERSVTNSSCTQSTTKSKRSFDGTPALRTRRDTFTGGATIVDINDPYIQEIAKFSVAEMDKGSNALYHRTIVRLIEAKKQVVAGTLVHLTYELGYSDCRKGTDHDPEQCKLKEESEKEICEVKVWDKPWLKQRSVTNFTCVQSAQRSKRSLGKIGGGTHDIHLGIFLKFMDRHGKKYDTEEEFRRRFHIFRANMKKVQYLQETEQGTAKYGPTQFADLTTQEFKSKHLGLNTKMHKKSKLVMKQAVIPNIKVADEFDWRDHNAVTPVKNQGQCGSCWAFSVTGNVEGQWAIQKGQLLSLSEQELVDCDSLDNGCNGGLPSNAYESIMNMGGLELETDYPYDGKDEKCHFDKSEVQAKVTGALNITTDEDGMARWLTKNGPISIGINANAMQFYFGGVSHPLKFLCNPKDLDHGVLIVGYGVHNYPLFNKTLPYWSVKNSWGPTWGEQGYYRVYRGDGTCGVNMMATSALVE